MFIPDFLFRSLPVREQVIYMYKSIVLGYTRLLLLHKWFVFRDERNLIYFAIPDIG